MLMYTDRQTERYPKKGKNIHRKTKKETVRDTTRQSYKRRAREKKTKNKHKRSSVKRRWKVEKKENKKYSEEKCWKKICKYLPHGKYESWQIL